MDKEVRLETKNRWSKPLAVGVLIGTILVCIGGVAFSRTDLGAAAKDSKKNHDAAAKQGLIFQTDEVARLYSVPESENGAALFREVMTVVKDNRWDDEKKLTEGKVFDKKDVFEAAVAKLEDASRRKYLIFKRDLSVPAAISYPEFSHLKAWVKFLSQMAEFAAAKGDPATAKRYLHIGAFLATRCDDEGILIGDLVRVSSTTIIESELKRIYNHHGKEQMWQDVISSTLGDLDQPYDVRKVLSLEHWFAVTSTDMALKEPGKFFSGFGSSTPTLLKAAKFIPKFKEANLSRIDAAYADAAAALPSDPYDFAATTKALRKLDEASSVQGLSYTLLSIVAPVFSQSIVAMQREVTYRNVLKQGLEFARTGRDPKQGLPIPGQQRLDMDGNPLRLKQVDGKWILYSIGSDGTDDGGAELANLKGDWVLHLPK